MINFLDNIAIHIAYISHFAHEILHIYFITIKYNEHSVIINIQYIFYIS